MKTLILFGTIFIIIYHCDLNISAVHGIDEEYRGSVLYDVRCHVVLLGKSNYTD